MLQCLPSPKVASSPKFSQDQSEACDPDTVFAIQDHYVIDDKKSQHLKKSLFLSTGNVVTTN